MKRKLAIILCAAILLTGCNKTSENIPHEPTNDIPDITESAENPVSSFEKPSAEAPHTIHAPDVTSGDAAEEDKTGFDNSDWITPKLSPEKVTYTLSGAVSAEKIAEYAGYDIDFDVTALDYYESSVEYVERCYEGEELEEIREHNYILKSNPSFHYLGTEAADWLATVSYGIYAGEATSFERLFLVKDGEVVRELEPLEDWILAAYCDRGEIYLSSAVNGLLKTNIATGESHVILKQDIQNDGWGMIAAINEDYIVYGGSMQKILVRETGEIIDPDINWNGMSSLPLILSDGMIYYTDWRREYHSYDIKKRVMTDGDSHNLSKITGYDYSDKWSVTVEDSSTSAIRVVNLYDGSERVYNLSALVGDISREELARYNTDYIFDGDRLWLHNWNELFCFVLNLETGEAADAELGLIKHNNTFISKGKFKVMDDDILYAADVNYPV